jgi:hypothetical protein
MDQEMASAVKRRSRDEGRILRRDGDSREYFGPPVRVFAGLSIVACERTLCVTKSQGYFQQTLTNRVHWGSSAICREHLGFVGV